VGFTAASHELILRVSAQDVGGLLERFGEWSASLAPDHDHFWDREWAAEGELDSWPDPEDAVGFMTMQFAPDQRQMLLAVLETQPGDSRPSAEVRFNRDGLSALANSIAIAGTGIQSSIVVSGEPQREGSLISRLAFWRRPLRIMVATITVQPYGAVID